MDFRSGIGQLSTPSYTWLNNEYKSNFIIEIKCKQICFIKCLLSLFIYGYLFDN